MKAFGFQGEPDIYEETSPVPVGELCAHCAEPIAEHDCGVVMPLLMAHGKPRIAAYHYECHIRLTVGSVKHQRGECGCFTGDFAADDDTDYPSRRAAAIAAAAEFYRKGKQSPGGRETQES